jgi:hypothetical protein
VDGPVTDPCAGGNKAVEEGLFAFVIRAFEEVALCRRKDRFKKSPGVAAPLKMAFRS